MVFELIPHSHQQFKCHCCPDTVQIVSSFTVLFINPQKNLIYVIRDLLDSVECAYLFQLCSLLSWKKKGNVATMQVSVHVWSNTCELHSYVQCNLIYFFRLKSCGIWCDVWQVVPKIWWSDEGTTISQNIRNHCPNNIVLYPIRLLPSETLWWETQNPLMYFVIHYCCLWCSVLFGSLNTSSDLGVLSQILGTEKLLIDC